MHHLSHVLEWLHHLHFEHAQRSWAAFSQHCGAIARGWNGGPTRGCG